MKIFLGINNKVAIGMAEQTSGMNDMSKSAEKIKGAFKGGLGNIMSFLSITLWVTINGSPFFLNSSIFFFIW